jgi:hypothetical protein
MKINPSHSALALVEADIVKALKASPVYGSYAVIGYQKMLLPSHEYVLPLRPALYMHIALACGLLKGRERGKSAPMLKIHVDVGIPVFMLCIERVFGANYFAFEICCKSRMVFS